MRFFEDNRQKKIAAEELHSHAQCLAAMDCLMHHISGEDELDCWLQAGIPDNVHWSVTEPDLDRAKFYYDLAKGMTYGDYESCVMIFAHAVKAQCFRTKYAPRAFV